jgi:hypothetical protein
MFSNLSTSSAKFLSKTIGSNGVNNRNTLKSLESEDGMVHTKVLTPLVDLADNIVTFTVLSECITHTGPVAIATMALSRFTEFLGNRGQESVLEMLETTTPDPVCTEISATSSIHFFIRTLQVRTTSSGKPVMQNVAFHVLAEILTDKKEEETKTAANPPAATTTEVLRIAFRTATDIEASELLSKQRRRKHVAAVRDSRSWLRSRDACVEGKAPVEATSVSGTITLEEREFGCTQVTIEASIAVKGGSKNSSKKTLGAVAKKGGGDKDGDSSTVSTAADSSASNLISVIPYKSAKMAVTAMTATKAVFKVWDDAAGEEATGEGINLSRSVTGFSDERLLPKSILEHLSTAALVDLHARQARYEGVDSAQRRHFAKAEVLKSAPRLEAHETDFVSKMLACNSPIACSDWRKTFGGTGASINFYEKTEDADGTTLTYSKIVAIMDVSAADLLARCWFFMSYENVHEHRARHGNLLRKEISVPSSHSKITLSVQRIKTGLDNRVFPAIWCWREEGDGSLTLAFGELDEYSHLPSDTAAGAAVSEARGVLEKSLDAAKSEMASSRGFWRVKPLAPNVCEVTYVFSHSLTSFVAAKYTRRVVEDVIILQKKLARNGAVVDGELRAVFPTPPTVKELLAGGEPDVTEILRNCEDLDSLHAGDKDWSHLPFYKLADPLVEKWMKYTPPKRGERTIGVGKAKTVVDSSAMNICGWVADYCSRERIRIGEEEGEKSRFIVERRSPHDFTAASLKHLPFPLRDREFVGRVICAFDDETQEFKFFSQAVDIPIDHGLNARTVRGTSMILMKIKPINETQCDLTIVTRVDPGGIIPASLVNSKMSAMLNLANELRTTFQRDDEMDRNERDELVRVMRDEEQTYSAEEIALEQRVRAKFASIREDQMEHLESPDDQTKMRKFFVPGQSSIVGMATAVVDASTEDCAAHQLMFMSREKQGENFEFNGMDRAQMKRNDHCSVIYNVYNAKVPGLQPREFLSLQIWKRQLDDNSIVFVVDAVDLPNEFPIRRNIVRATCSILWKMAPLPPLGGVVQTRVTKFHQIDMKGAVPKFVVNNKTVMENQLMSVALTRKLFDRSLEVGAASRARLIEKINGHTDRYSIEEANAVENELAKFGLFEKNKSKKLSLSSPLTEAKLISESDHRGLLDHRLTYGMAITTVRTRPVDVLSFFLDTTSSSNAEHDDLEKSVDEAPNGHNQLVYWRTVMPGALLGDRDFVSRVIWKKTDDGFVLVTRPEESAGRKPVKDQDQRSTRRNEKRVIRGHFPSAMKITRLSDSETRVAYIIHPTWGNSGTEWLFDRFVVTRLERVSRVQQYFLELRTMEQYDAADGKAMGTRFMYPGGDKSKKPWEKVEEIVRKHQGLAKLLGEFPALVALLQEIVRGKLAMAGSVSTKLECLSKAEAKKIGRSLAPALKSRKTPEAGLYQWKCQNTSIVELCQQHPWVESMLLEMSRILLKTAPWGLAWRVGFGAFISQLDLWSDIAVIVEYLYTPGRVGFGFALLVMLGACLALQLLIVTGQNWKKKEILQAEVLIVVAGVKAPYDAWNVVRGKEQEEHTLFDPRMELVLTKGVEMFTEAIPGCILQIYVALKFLEMGERVSKRAVFSIVVSALTTGYNSATLTYDYDSDPKRRMLNPKFYGLIPDDGNSRAILLVFMTLNSALLLLVRSFGTALLLLTNWRLFAQYAVGDVALYLLQKIARGDFLYWIPLDGTAGIVGSLLVRVAAKTIADYTGCLQLRASGELGGIYFSWSMLQAVIFSFAAAALYFQEKKGAVLAVVSDSSTNSTGADGEGSAALQGYTVWWMVSSTSAMWLLSFVGILVMMKRKYLRTFFSFETGRRWVMSCFLNGDCDESRGSIFRFNKNIWASIRKEVKAWTLANWWRWKREKPEWLTEALIGKIPDDFIPKEEDRKALEGARMSARLSLKGVLGAAEGHAATRTKKAGGGVRKGARVEAVN